MTDLLHLDARGRVTIPKKLRRFLEGDFVAIATPRGIVLHPAPDHVDLPIAAEDATGEGVALAEAGHE